MVYVSVRHRPIRFQDFFGRTGLIMNLNSSIEPILSLSRTNWNQVFRKSNLAFIRVIIDSCCYLLMSRDYEKKRVWPHIKGSSSLVHPSKSSSAVGRYPEKSGKVGTWPKTRELFWVISASSSKGTHKYQSPHSVRYWLHHVTYCKICSAHVFQTWRTLIWP